MSHWIELHDPVASCKCGTSLDKYDISEGRCPFCNAFLPGSLAWRIHHPEGPQTEDERVIAAEIAGE